MNQLLADFVTNIHPELIDIQIEYTTETVCHFDYKTRTIFINLLEVCVEENSIFEPVEQLYSVQIPYDDRVRFAILHEYGHALDPANEIQHERNFFKKTTLFADKDRNLIYRLLPSERRADQFAIDVLAKYKASLQTASK